MRIIRSAKELTPAKKVCLAIGVFDGVHLGHQQVIRQMVTDARQQEAHSAVITFDRHPNTVVALDRVPPLIYSLPQKLRAIAALEVDTTLLIHFDEPFSRQSGEQFIRGLARDFGQIHSICVGSAFTFGHKRSGNVALLKKLGTELGFMVHGLAAVSLDGEVVSSTRIREAIRNGQLDLAGQMLGRGYSLAGQVIRGDQLGRQLGIPTANLDIAGLMLPPSGVYAVHAIVRGAPSPRNGPSPRRSGQEAGASDAGGEKPTPSPLNGERAGVRGETSPDPHETRPASYRAVLNIGVRPTLQSQTPELRVEVHLFDFAGDLYGQELEVSFVEKIRDEQKFPSLAALKEQIAHDIMSAKALFSGKGH